MTMKLSNLSFWIIAAVLAGVAGCGKSHSAATTELSLTPQRARLAGIETAIASEAQIRTTLTLHGSIRPNAEREQDIRARYPGVVRDVNKRVGDQVIASEELLRVESNESLQTYPIRSPIPGRIIER